MAEIRLSSRRIREIRRALGFSRTDFARTLWAASKTVMEWENGKRSPMGMHRRLLILCEQGLAAPSFLIALQDPRSTDPMFLLFRLLEPLYGNRKTDDIPKGNGRALIRAKTIVKRLRMAKQLTPKQIQTIRKALGFSQGEFAHILWVTYSTLSRWEHGLASPFGVHLRILTLLKHNLSSHNFNATLCSPRRADHLFLLHQLLEAAYGDLRNPNLRRE